MKPKAISDTPLVLMKRVEELFEQFGAGWEDRWLVASLLQTKAITEMASSAIEEIRKIRELPTPVEPAPPIPLRAEPAPSPYTSSEYLTERQVAKVLNVSVACLHKWRRGKQGPKAVKMGRLVRYRYSDVEAFLG